MPVNKRAVEAAYYRQQSIKHQAQKKRLRLTDFFVPAEIVISLPFRLFFIPFTLTIAIGYRPFRPLEGSIIVLWAMSMAIGFRSFKVKKRLRALPAK